MAIPVYDDTNIFARILRGEIPAARVLEDDYVIAFMDVMPQADGHTLVVPREPSRNILDIAPGDLTHLILAVQRVARAVKAAFGAEGVVVMQFNEEPAGQSVFHTHVHVIPRFAKVALRPHSGALADPSLLAEHAARIREALETA